MVGRSAPYPPSPRGRFLNPSDIGYCLEQSDSAFVGLVERAPSEACRLVTAS